MDNLFEMASRKQFRFSFNKGTMNIEDLWDLNLESLDRLAKSLNKELKEQEEESFIKTRTVANKTLEAKFELVKYIITVKLKEAEEKELKVQKAAKKQQLLDLIGRKEIQSLENKSIEELTAELQAL